MKRLLLALCLLLAFVPAASAANARDVGTCSTGTGAGATLTISHTATGSHLFMSVVITDAAVSNVTGVTYNSVALTANPDSPLQPGGPGDRFVLNYYLGDGNVATGTNNLVVTSGGSATIWAEVCTYSGVANSQPEARGVVTTVGTSPTTASATVATANAWTIYMVSDTGGTQAASTGSTLYGCSASTIACIYDSNGTVSTGSHSMSITNGGTGSQGGFILSLAPFTGSATVPCRRALLGVGCDDFELETVGAGR